MSRAKVVESSGSVFEDIGFSAEESRLLTLKSQLMLDLTKHLKKLGLKQQAASSLLGVTQSRVSDLVNGKVSQFSLDMLVTLADRAGLSVQLALPRRAGRQPKSAAEGLPGFYRRWQQCTTEVVHWQGMPRIFVAQTPIPIALDLARSTPVTGGLIPTSSQMQAA